MKRLALLGALVLLIMAIAAPASAKQNKEYVCHHTGSNMVVRIHVANWNNGHVNADKPGNHHLNDVTTTGEGHAAVPFFEGDCGEQPS